MPRGWGSAQLIVWGGLLLVILFLIARPLVRRFRAALRRTTTPPPPAPDQLGPPPRALIIANPTKIPDLVATREWLTARSLDLGWAPPAWAQTTPEQLGGPQAEAGTRDGVTAVIAYGGDGTVRSVAGALTGTDVPLGILPAGTGNLLARNLALPITDLVGAFDVALTGTNRRIDVGHAEIDVSGEDETSRREIFMVMAGLGFDAEVMAAVGPELKARLGWWAYVVAGMQRLHGRQTRVSIRMDDQPVRTERIRSVIVGNCGELTAGMRLMPEALLDDGRLDVVIVAPRFVLGWAAVVASAMAGRGGARPMVRHFTCKTIEVHAERPLHVQLDGDPAGSARVLRATVDPLALVVRTR